MEEPKQIIVDLEDKSSVESALNELIEITKIKNYFPNGTGNINYSDYERFDYKLGKMVDGNFVSHEYSGQFRKNYIHMYHDKIAYIEAVLSFGLEKKYEEFLKNIIKLNNVLDGDYHPCICIWVDDELTLGLIEAAVLAALKKEYIPIFNEMMATSDIDHEVFVAKTVAFLKSSYEWCEDIVDMVIYYAIHSENGKYNFEDYLRTIEFQEYLSNEKNLKHLREAIKKGYEGEKDRKWAEDSTKEFNQWIEQALS